MDCKVGTTERWHHVRFESWSKEQAMLKISRPRVRLHDPIKQFAENRPPGMEGRSQIERSLAHSLNSHSFCHFINTSAPGAARARSLESARAPQPHQSRAPTALAEKNENKNTQHTPLKFIPTEKAPRVDALKVDQERHVSEPASRTSHALIISRSQGWTDDSALPAKGQCTSSSWSCSIQLTQCRARLQNRL
jgi:hypothetical protein